MLSWWTVGRATGIGMLAGLVALLLWPAYVSWPERLLVPFTAALLVMAVCGVSILIATAVDLATRRRSARLRPVRAFDLGVAGLLAVPSLVELNVLAEHWGG